MIEYSLDRTHTEQAVLDIGQDIGALVIYTKEALRGKEVQLSQKGNSSAKMLHTAVWERRFNGRTVWAGIYAELPQGDYIIWTHPSHEVTITGGHVAELDLSAVSDLFIPPANHAHGSNLNALISNAANPLLPPRYRNGQQVCATPMGSAPLRYADDGQVVWNELWTDFCDLALAGGPPHRGSLLEPPDPAEAKSAPADYQRVVAEIERGFRLVTGRPTQLSEQPGWVGLVCTDEEMALWMLRAIVVENVCVRRENNILFLPAGPRFRLEAEIKNVITVVAKTYHYWTEHLLAP